MTIDTIHQFEKAEILVTGGAGFIGSNLCESLLQQGAHVTCLDNFSTGKEQNIEGFKDHPNFILINGDIKDFDTCKKSVKGKEFVLHQAALGSVPRSIKDPITSNENNISGFLNMLVASKDEGINRFIYAASSSTYGDSISLPKEESKIGSPLSPYAITKYVNELYADVFHKTYGLDCIGLRYFNVFGRKQDPQGSYAAVIPKFINQLIKHESPTINGDGSFSRDFTYIDNVVEANIKSMLSTNNKSLNTVYNIAYGERTTLDELIIMLKGVLASYDAKILTIAVNYGPEREGDVPHSLASINKAKSLLNYDPKFDLKSGLEAAIDWYWNNL